MNPIEKTAQWVSSHPKKAIGITLILTVIFMGLSSTVKEEMSLESFFPEYKEVETMKTIQKEFGNEEATIILLEGEDVLTPQSFQQTAEIIERLRKNDSIYTALIEPKDQAINSLPSMLAYYKTFSQGNPNSVPEKPLTVMRSFSSEKEIKKTLKAFLNDQNIPQSMKNYALMFLPKNFDTATLESNKMVIYVSLDASLSKETLQEIELQIEDISKAAEGPNKVSAYGFSLLDHYYMETEKRLVPAFLAALVLVLLIMAVNFRRISDIAISLSTLFLAIIWTTGFAGLMGWPLNIMTGMVPILILGLGIDFSFHTLMGYREKLAAAENDPQKATQRLLATVGIALALAAVTTFVGFSSNGISQIPSMRHFGFLAGFSIFSIFFLNMTFVPSIREFLDLRRKGKALKSSDRKEMAENIIVKKLGRLMNHPVASGAIVLIVLAITVPGLVLGFTMKASYDPTGELASDLEITHTYKTLTTEFEVGTETIFVRIAGDLTDPLLWQQVQKATENMSNDPYVVTYRGEARTESLLSMMPLLLSENPSLMPVYLQVDKTMDGTIDENVSSETLKRFLTIVYQKKEAKYFIHRNENGKFDALLIRVMTDTKMGYHGMEALSDLKEDFKEVENVKFAGTPIMWAKGMNDMRDSMTNSILLCLAFAFIVLPIIFTLTHNSPLLGFLTALSPFIVIGWLFMTMNILNIPLNSMTAMIGAIIVGIGIDYPIHVANRWALESKEKYSLEECYTISIGTTGKEVFYSSLTTLVAFATFLSLNMPVIVQFGQAAVFGLLYSLLGAVIILPLLLQVVWHRGR